MKRRWLALLVCGFVGQPAWSAEHPQRDELKRQRQAIEADYARREEGCRRQFVVTPCLDRLRAGKQEALSAIRAQEDALDAHERLERAEAQKRRLADKARAAQVRRAAALTSAPSAPPAPVPAVPTRPAPARVAKPALRPASAPHLQEQEARKRAEFEARKRDIEAHRLQIEKRNAERARRSPARPLPVPASGAG